MLRQVGVRDRYAEAAQTLPGPVDIDRDGDRLASYGLELDHLIHLFGGSP